jgi:hypothetical protein
MFAMKKLMFTVLSLLIAGILSGQPIIDLGLKAGATFSNLHFSENIQYFSQNTLGYHAGAFSRIGWGSFFVQPEVYFNSRGGNLKSTNNSVTSAVASFDFSSVDVPLLAGIRLLKKQVIQFRVMAGPMLGFMTSRKVEPRPTFEQLFSKEYFQDHLFGWQTGLGVDFLRFSLDVRLERSRNSVYQSNDFTTKNNLVLVSLGMKIF